MANEKEKYPPYHLRSDVTIRTLFHSCRSNAELSAKKFMEALKKWNAFKVDSEEDELEFVIKKYARSRNAKHHRKI